MSDQGSGPFPGWYDDPEAPGRQRYWDGRAWTEHVTGPADVASPASGPTTAATDAASPAAAAAPPQPSPQQQPPQPTASPYAPQPASATVSDKSFVATWLLAWLLGVLGIDRFYLGKVGTGILKLITAGGLGIWWLVDLILVLAGAQRDKRGRRLEGYEEHKRVAWIVTIVVIAIGAVVGPMTPWWMPFGS